MQEGRKNSFGHVEDDSLRRREESKPKKLLKKRTSNVDKSGCDPARVVKGPCATPLSEGTNLAGLPAKIFALEKTVMPSF